MRAYRWMSMNPICTPLIIGVDWHNIGEIATRWDATVSWISIWDQTSLIFEIDALKELPLRHLSGTVHPRSSCKKHPMMMEGCRLIYRIRDMKQQFIAWFNLDRRWSKSRKYWALISTITGCGKFTYGQVLLTPITRRSNRPSGLAFSM